VVHDAAAYRATSRRPDGSSRSQGLRAWLGGRDWCEAVAVAPTASARRSAGRCAGRARNQERVLAAATAVFLREGTTCLWRRSPRRPGWASARCTAATRARTPSWRH
jgi:hypothetical protein